jgi:hypothetical protein
MPSSPKGWFLWSAFTLEAQSRPFSPRYEFLPPQDFRTRDSRESALSIKILMEKASHSVCGNGIGVELMEDFYLREASWWSFTEPERRIIEKTARAFAKALREVGFTPDGNP